MASESETPAPRHSSAKYVVIGVLCLGAAAALWFFVGREPAPKPAAPEPPPEVARVNPMAEHALELPEPEPDAGVEEPAEPEPPEKKRRARGSRRGPWDCSGDLAGAAKVVNAHRSQVRSCYERRLKVNNILQGDLRLRVKVGPTGRVVATSVSGSLGDAEVFRCVRAIAEQWAFESPTGGNCAVLDVPFAFAPKTE